MILVTGGAGFIGSHICVELIESGFNIVIADDLYNSSESVINSISQITGKSIEYYKIDVSDISRLRQVFTKHKIDAVIHLAGFKAVSESVARPLLYYRNNLGSTITLCRIMDEFNCRIMVFSSSATAYGLNNTPPYTEDMPLSATNPYGRTKAIQEQILSDLASADSRWHIAILRYFNPIGAHSSGLIGENPSGIPNNLMPYICRVAKGELPYLNIFGKNYLTHDGTGVRDYIHVVDLAKGHINALRYIENHAGVLTVNMGRGEGYSVLDVVKAFERTSGIKIPLKFVKRRPGDIAAYWANVHNAEKILNWRAVLSLDDMCVDSWRFVSYKSNLHS
jgi:UDP-glucose 4-epimerase